MSKLSIIDEHVVCQVATNASDAKVT